MRNFSETNVENIKTYISLSIIFPPENRAVYEKMWKKYGRTGQATDDNTAHARCMREKLRLQTHTQNTQ